MPDHLAAELHDAAVVERDLLDATTYPVPGFQYQHVRTAGREITRSAQTGQPGTEDDDIVRHCKNSYFGYLRGARQCSGCQPIRTRSPSAQRSSVRAECRFCSSTESSTPGAISKRYVVVAPP